MAHILSRCVQYSKHGDPRQVRTVLMFERSHFQVLALNNIQIDTNLSSNDVLVKWYASPINPLDVNKIEGNYPIFQQMPMVGGSEGAGVVEKVFEFRPFSIWKLGWPRCLRFKTRRHGNLHGFVSRMERIWDRRLLAVSENRWQNRFGKILLNR